MTNPRPGGRASAITDRVTDAVIGLLTERGVAACTFQEVAERAAVQRSTLYRRYRDRWDMMSQAIVQFAGDEVVAASHGSFADDLRDILLRLLRQLESPLGPALFAVAAALRENPDRELATSFWKERLGQLEPMFATAIARGELPADVNREEVFSFAAGPLYFRMLVAQQTGDPGWIDPIVEAVCARYCG